tara:strand:- start:24598 stop:25776 length:1179 start_codon:yes stop_codon:yes gene_type:complete
MEANGFYAGIHMPKAADSDEQYKYGFLPPCNRLKSYLVDEYPAVPSNWMKSEGNTSSYFVGMEEDQGMWIDLNKNQKHSHHVAVVISIQGVNPITGMPCKGNNAGMEQYIKECPKCEKKFSANRHCKSCGFKWPKQNYISTNATTYGEFWLDGFRAADGVIRQYILTQEKMRSVAGNVTGGNQVYAIGLSFFISKKEKPDTQTWYGGERSGIIYGQPMFFSPVYTPINWQIPPTYTTYTSSSSKPSNNACLDGDVVNNYHSQITENQLDETRGKKSSAQVEEYHTAPASAEDIERVREQLANTTNDPNLTLTTSHSFEVKEVDVAKVEVGAGSKIDQMVADDPETLDFWKNKPEAMICVNYCLEANANEILSQGKIPLNQKEEGFMQEMLVG